LLDKKDIQIRGDVYYQRGTCSGYISMARDIYNIYVKITKEDAIGNN
jgi:hypothetical protein